MLDQDYQTINQMTTLRNIYETVQGAPRYTGAKIHDMPPSMLRIMAYLKREGLWRPTIGADG